MCMCLVSCLYLNSGNNYWKIGGITVQAEVLTDVPSFINSYVVIFCFCLCFCCCLFVCFPFTFAALYRLCIYENIDFFYDLFFFRSTWLSLFFQGPWVVLLAKDSAPLTSFSASSRA